MLVEAPRSLSRKIILCTVLVYLSAFLFCTTDAPARNIASKIEAEIKGTVLTVYTYTPDDCTPSSLLFVFHGLGRTARSYRNAAMDLADKMCLIVYAPLFDKKRFPGWRYNRGGIVRDGRVLPQTEWTVGYVRDLLQWARLREQRPGAPYYLFGHSAGGQFLSRVAAFGLPADARRIVIANPSTYVLPSLDEDAPYGLGNAFDKRSGEKQLREYLKLPLTVYLGDEDTGDKDLTQNGPAMRQGENRLERGENFFELGHSVAKENGWEFGWRLVKARSVGHSARKMLSADEALYAFE